MLLRVNRFIPSSRVQQRRHPPPLPRLRKFLPAATRFLNAGGAAARPSGTAPLPPSAAIASQIRPAAAVSSFKPLLVVLLLVWYIAFRRSIGLIEERGVVIVNAERVISRAFFSQPPENPNKTASRPPSSSAGEMVDISVSAAL